MANRQPSDEEIVQAFASDNLLEEIFDRFSMLENEEQIVSALVTLHNNAKIDLLGLTDSDAFQNMTPAKFFMGQHLYCEAIPHLVAPARKIMQCVRELVRKGGDDGAAGFPYTSFEKWCQVDIARSREVLSLARANDDLAIEFLGSALIAGNLREEATRIVREFDGKRRISAINALGKMSWTDLAASSEAIKTLALATEDDRNSETQATVLLASLDIAVKGKATQSDELMPLIRRCCDVPGPQMQLACARCIWMQGAKLSESIVAELLRPLASISKDHIGIVKELDHGLRRMLDTPHSKTAVDFIERLILASNTTWALSDFHVFSSHLRNKQRATLHQLFIRWMLSGEPHLCSSISDLIWRSVGDNQPLELDLGGIELTPKQQAFLCRKAVGYLFFHPVVVSSIIVSILRICDRHIAKEVRKLLFDPLLLNYGGTLRSYLGSLKADDKARKHANFALKEADTYIKNLRTVGTISDLHPSEHQRQIERARNLETMRAIQKSAEKQSVLFNLVKRSTILYGRRTITYVKGPDNNDHAVQIALKEHSVAYEIPRMDVIDPIGLSFKILTYRVEKIAQ